jgi:hypothetical protein
MTSVFQEPIQSSRAISNEALSTSPLPRRSSAPKQALLQLNNQNGPKPRIGETMQKRRLATAMKAIKLTEAAIRNHEELFPNHQSTLQKPIRNSLNSSTTGCSTRSSVSAA